MSAGRRLAHGQCLPRHRHEEFLKFLRTIDRQVPKGLVERWFRDLTGKALRRGAFKSVPDLITAIEAYLQANNDHPRPFTWTATAEDILEKVRRGRVTLERITS